MSQIGLAYGLSGVDLIECVKLARAHDYKRFWEQFGRHEIRPAFEHSGEVLLVVDEYLRERGVELPLNEAAPEFDFLAGEGGVVACASSAEAAATGEALARLVSKGADLGRFWKEWFGESDDRAEEFMRAGLDWLRRAFEAGVSAEWCLIWVC